MLWRREGQKINANIKKRRATLLCTVQDNRESGQDRTGQDGQDDNHQLRRGRKLNTDIYGGWV